MTPSELTTRVTLDTCAAVATLAALGWWLVGASTGLGVLAGGVLAVVNFRWLVARAFVATEIGSTSSAAWMLGAGLRFAACAGACGILLAYGWAHPVALVAGFTVLPCDLIARGLEAARTER
jgi:ATP synthase I subunit